MQGIQIMSNIVEFYCDQQGFELIFINHGVLNIYRTLLLTILGVDENTNLRNDEKYVYQKHYI